MPLNRLKPVFNIPFGGGIELHNHKDLVAHSNYVSGQVNDIYTGNVTLTGEKTIQGDVTVFGTFSALSAIIITTEEFKLSSNFIDLNSNLLSGAPFEDAGIRVKRGDETDAEIRWVEDGDYWSFTGDIDLSGAIDNTYISITVTQAGHGFSVLDAIYNNAGTWTKAQANDADTLGVAIVTDVIDANTFTYKSVGKAVFTSHGFTVGQYLLVSADTAGALTETAPTGIQQYSNPIAYVLDSNTLLIFPWKPTQALTRANDVKFTSVDTDYTVLDTDEIILVDALSGAVDITVDQYGTDYVGFSWEVKKTDASANAVTVKALSGNIDGVSGLIGKSITTQYETLTVAHDGTNYWIR